MSKYNVGLKTFLLQGLLEHELYGNFVYKFRKISGKNDFSYQFKKIIVRYKKIGCYTDRRLNAIMFYVRFLKK